MFPMHGYSPWSLCDDDDEEAQTQRSADTKPPKLTFDVEYVPLFTSATWTIKAKLNDDLLFAQSFDESPSEEAIDRWACEFIKREKSRLKVAGIDVVAEYTSYGGNEIELF